MSRVAAQHAGPSVAQANPELSVEEVFAAVLERGQTALEETTQQNPVLAKAGVVDAGGFGFLTILEGMRDAYLGIHKERAIPEDTPSKAAADFPRFRMRTSRLLTAPNLLPSARIKPVMSAACAPF